MPRITFTPMILQRKKKRLPLWLRFDFVNVYRERIVVKFLLTLRSAGFEDQISLHNLCTICIPRVSSFVRMGEGKNLKLNYPYIHYTFGSIFGLHVPHYFWQPPWHLLDLVAPEIPPFRVIDLSRIRTIQQLGYSNFGWRWDGGGTSFKGENYP